LGLKVLILTFKVVSGILELFLITFQPSKWQLKGGAFEFKFRVDSFQVIGSVLLCLFWVGRIPDHKQQPLLWGGGGHTPPYRLKNTPSGVVGGTHPSSAYCYVAEVSSPKNTCGRGRRESYGGHTAQGISSVKWEGGGRFVKKSRHSIKN